MHLGALLLLLLVPDTLTPINGLETGRRLDPKQVPSGDSLDTLVLSFAGDCTFANHFEDFVGNRSDYPFKQFGVLSQSDISMVNLENPITYRTQKVKKQFNFRMDPKYLRILQIAGIDIVTLANNHVFDYGPEGLLDTIHFLDSAGIKHVGAGGNLTEARRPVVFDIRGFRVGFLGYFGSGTFAATSTRPGVAPRSEAAMQMDIQALKQIDKVDYVVVNIHWGKEKGLYPQQWQINLAHFAVDAGADLVIGHHPHVLQGIEKFRNSVIAYSLGNFLFGGNSRSTYDTAILKAELRRGFRRITIVPIHVKDWQPCVSSGIEGERTIASVKERSRRFPESIF